MKIILINPPWVIRGKKNIWRNVASIMPPLGIAWLGAVLEQEGHQVNILDAHALRLSIHRITRFLKILTSEQILNPWEKLSGPHKRSAFIWKRLKKLRSIDDCLSSIQGFRSMVGI